MWYIVNAESLDWCGCESAYYKVQAETEDEAIDIANANSIEDEVWEFYDEDEDDEDYIAPYDRATTVKAMEYDEEIHGDLSEYSELT